MNTSDNLVRMIPLLGQLRGYRREWLASDLVAGCSVCVILVPSVIAYAELVGIAPVHGLYAALCGMIAYAVFASSRHVITGPDAQQPMQRTPSRLN